MEGSGHDLLVFEVGELEPRESKTCGPFLGPPARQRHSGDCLDFEDAGFFAFGDGFAAAFIFNLFNIETIPTSTFLINRLFQ
jgi:hypothetical protein